MLRLWLWCLQLVGSEVNAATSFGIENRNDTRDFEGSRYGEIVFVVVNKKHASIAAPKHIKLDYGQR
jgi:hypothetical protein